MINFTVPQKVKILLLVLIFIVAGQSLSLLRAYPEKPPCGQVIEVISKFHILVNCDSAQFMKDADNPSRLVNGKSDYADRPMYATSANLMVRFLKILGTPDSRKLVRGISGESYSYSLLTFLVYIFFNFLILLSACFLAINTLVRKFEGNVFKMEHKSLVLLVLSLTSLNELTKTFFWTPHSQIFNIFFPIAAIHLISMNNTFIKSKKFYILNFLIGIGLFYYPLFGLLYFILVRFSIFNFKKRLFVVLVSLIPYLVYGRVVKNFGGVYRNASVSKFREFVWPFDLFKSHDKVHFVWSKIYQIITSFPLIPVLIICLCLLFLFYKFGFKTLLKEEINLILFGFIYVIYIFGIGLGERRIALGLVIFIGIAILNFVAKRVERLPRTLLIGAGGVLLGFHAYSWILTNGPLY